MSSVPERKDSLWWLTVAPSIWALHFLACYITVALWCEKVAIGSADGLGVTRWVALAYTIVALAGITAAGVRAYRRHRTGIGSIPHDFDTPADRHRFLGFAGLLLSVMSGLAVVYVALPFGFLAACR